MTTVVELIILAFSAISGAVIIALLVRSLIRPKPARRLLTLVIEEREMKRPATHDAAHGISPAPEPFPLDRLRRP